MSCSMCRYGPDVTVKVDNELLDKVRHPLAVIHKAWTGDVRHAGQPLLTLLRSLCFKQRSHRFIDLKQLCSTACRSVRQRCNGAAAAPQALGFVKGLVRIRILPFSFRTYLRWFARPTGLPRPREHLHQPLSARCLRDFQVRSDQDGVPWSAKCTGPP